MKRYNIGTQSVRSSIMETDESGKPILIIRVDQKMIEHPEGEWVKREDVVEYLLNRYHDPHKPPKRIGPEPPTGILTYKETPTHGQK